MDHISGYRSASLTVDKFIKARNRDLLPDRDTELALGISGGERGRKLYGAYNTLFLHGRVSRTMLEQALVFSPTSYPEYVKLWIRSLPPAQRSMYAAELYNSNFRGIKWDEQLYRNISLERLRGDDFEIIIQPPTPLGDDRHSPKNAKVAACARDFFNLLNHGVLFDGCAGDVHAKLEENDELSELASLFGVDYTELNWSERSENRTMSHSELILRTWNVLYFAQRLSITELECALMNGRKAMSKLLTNGVELSVTAVDLEGKPMAERGRDILTNAQKLFEDRGIEEITNRFAELFVDDEADKKHLNCDYCGDDLQKSRVCSRCKTAM